MNRFREARMRAALSQKVAALSIGVKPPSMSDWENGKTSPSQDHLVAMANLYGVTVDYLLGNSSDPTKKEPPTVAGEELRDATISRLYSLSDPALLRVSDFLDGLEAGLSIGPAAPPDQDPGAGSDK